MYGKMQESGLTEIIPLTGTLAIWGQYPVFSHPEFPQGSPEGVAAVWWLLNGRYSFLPECPQGSLAHTGRLQLLMTVTSQLLIWQEIFHFLIAIHKPNRGLRRNQPWDFPGGPAVDTPHFPCSWHGFDPWSGNCAPPWHIAQQQQQQSFL